MKYLIYILLLTFASCITVNNRSDVLDLDNIGDTDGFLKTKGYYYAELEQQAYLYYKNQYGGYSQDSSKPYMQKLIQPLILYENGGVENGSLTSGMKENLANQSTCGLADNNSVFFAKLYFECGLSRAGNADQNDFGTLYAKGVFKAQRDKIVVQYYGNYGPPMIAEYYLIEKKGAILNDSTFVLKSMYNFRTKELIDINETYFYQAYSIKPDTENYILSHKKRFKNK